MQTSHDFGEIFSDTSHKMLPDGQWSLQQISFYSFLHSKLHYVFILLLWFRCNSTPNSMHLPSMSASETELHRVWYGGRRYNGRREKLQKRITRVKWAQNLTKKTLRKSNYTDKKCAVSIISVQKTNLMSSYVLYNIVVLKYNSTTIHLYKNPFMLLFFRILI